LCVSVAAPYDFSPDKSTITQTVVSSVRKFYTASRVQVEAGFPLATAAASQLSLQPEVPAMREE
jgi:hypothetical protein